MCHVVDKNQTQLAVPCICIKLSQLFFLVGLLILLLLLNYG